MLVSVIIPSYNHKSYIGKAVESVLSQTHRDLELIVVDDGSSDGSVELLRAFTDSRLRLLTQANAGAHAAINRGLQEAEGEYLAILNSDDIFMPSRLSECLSALTEGGADLVATWIEVINTKGKPLGIKEGWRNMLPWEVPAIDWGKHNLDAFAGNLLASNFVSTTSNVVFSRRLYEGVGGMRNLRFAHDWDFLLRACDGYRCALIEKPLLQYRIHNSNTISSNRAWMLFEICWVLATGWRRIEKNVLFRSARTQDLVEDMRLLANAINLQGNDKVYWMIRQFLEVGSARGIDNVEELLLDDAALRESFLAHIQC